MKFLVIVRRIILQELQRQKVNHFTKKEKQSRPKKPVALMVTISEKVPNLLLNYIITK